MLQTSGARRAGEGQRGFKETCVQRWGGASSTTSIFEISCLSVASFAIIFSHSEGFFTLLVVFFVVQKLLILIRSHLFIFAFISNIPGGGS